LTLNPKPCAPSGRAVELDLDALDDLPGTAHLYVTYDDPASRHTLAVARVVPPNSEP